MPIGSRCWRWFEPRLRSGSTGMKAGLAALFVCAAFVYVFLGPLVFDASYWVLGKAARVQADRRLRVGVSVAFVAESMAARGKFHLVHFGASPSIARHASKDPISSDDRTAARIG